MAASLRKKKRKPPPGPGHTILTEVGPYLDCWDSKNVKMPCSEHNIIKVVSRGTLRYKIRWELICRTLEQENENSHQLQHAILHYNKPYQGQWDYSVLHDFFECNLDEFNFFDRLLPSMVELALRLPDICTQPIPLLKKQRQHAITMSQEQIASLLANAFFCTFPRRNALGPNTEYGSFPNINMNTLLKRGKPHENYRKTEKLKCILHYFDRVTRKMPKGNVTFERKVCPNPPSWSSSSKLFTDLTVSNAGTIEDGGKTMLKVDFANKFVGGGVLGSGSVQEEILFVIFPEMLISRLFTEELDENESLHLYGCERFSNYTGYSDTFTWAGDYKDLRKRDSWGRRPDEIVAIDALSFKTHDGQFTMRSINRELLKAYCGFMEGDVQTKTFRPVATGNWGCGAFRGDAKLKAVIQLLAAAEAGRSVHYFTFGDAALCNQLTDLHTFLRGIRASVSDVWLALDRYCQLLNRASGGRGGRRDLYTFIKNSFDVGVGRSSSKRSQRRNMIDRHSSADSRQRAETTYEEKAHLEPTYTKREPPPRPMPRTKKKSKAQATDNYHGTGEDRTLHETENDSGFHSQTEISSVVALPENKSAVVKSPRMNTSGSTKKRPKKKTNWT